MRKALAIDFILAVIALCCGLYILASVVDFFFRSLVFKLSLGSLFLSEVLVDSLSAALKHNCEWGTLFLLMIFRTGSWIRWHCREGQDWFWTGAVWLEPKDVWSSIDINDSPTSNIRTVKASLYGFFDYKQSLARLLSVFTMRLDNWDVL